MCDGAIGELSMFHETYGYYAHGIDDTTATLPAGWASRLVPINNENTAGAIGWCLDVHDLALSKLVAGRDKDLEYVAAANPNINCAGVSGVLVMVLEGDDRPYERPHLLTKARSQAQNFIDELRRKVPLGK